MNFLKMFKRDESINQLAALLADARNKESLLGTKEPVIPTPDLIRKDAAKISNYSTTSDYKAFADEVWARCLNHLDIIQDDRTPIDKLQYHRGALKASLDLLRLSFQARSIVERADEEQGVPLPHGSRRAK